MKRQLDLFPLSKEEELLSELSSTKKGLDNLRKGLFSRQSDLAKDVMRMQDKLESLQNQLFILEAYVRRSLKE